MPLTRSVGVLVGSERKASGVRLIAVIDDEHDDILPEPSRRSL